jgi:hypothetical protein
MYAKNIRPNTKQTYAHIKPPRIFGKSSVVLLPDLVMGLVKTAFCTTELALCRPLPTLSRSAAIDFGLLFVEVDLT